MTQTVKGLIITPGAKGTQNVVDGFTAAFPINLPVIVNSITEERVIVTEPRGQEFVFDIKDIQMQDVDEQLWQEEWDRHQNPKKHRWDIVELVEEYGAEVYSDWECGPFPSPGNREFFQMVFDQCKNFSKEDDPEFNNALIDLTLLMFAEHDDLGLVDAGMVEATAYTISQLLTCKQYTKSGNNWSQMNLEEWLDSLGD